ncbi:unnamed protein product [Linum tenue]|uniref:Uncharacterized protein n=1 Tax=Linum tenue TaxID=586396 RepID=A0AAV0PJK9_9ROSI|nr:unnamed protein product [Linum tenue]
MEGTSADQETAPRIPNFGVTAPTPIPFDAAVPPPPPPQSMTAPPPPILPHRHQQTPPQTAGPPPPTTFSRKRGPESDGGSYFKIRAVIKDIRPHLLEVIRTADFRSCKGAHQIQEKLKLLMELCKQMTAETGGNYGKSRFAAQNGGAQDIFAKPSDDRIFNKVVVTERPENYQNQLVGSSAFGWNFITYPGCSEPVYYGRTKESFRAARLAAAAAAP